MVELLQVLEGLAYIGFIAGAIFALIELQGMKKDRRLELVMQAGIRSTSKEFEEAVCKLWRANTTDAKELEERVSYVELSMMADFYAGMANLVLERIVDRRALTSFIAFGPVWDKLKPFVLAERAATGLVNSWDPLEKMAQLESRSG